MPYCQRHTVRDILSETYCQRHTVRHTVSVRDILSETYCQRHTVRDILSETYFQRHTVRDILSVSETVEISALFLKVFACFNFERLLIYEKVHWGSIPH